MVTATKAFQEVRSRAEAIRNDQTQRFSEGAGAGDTFAQGDVYFTLLDALPKGCVPAQLDGDLQLAPGTTQGSRHRLESSEGVAVMRLPDPGILDGPILILTEERTVTHPEHGHVVLPGKRIYAVSYQRSLDAEEREHRVQD